MLDPPRSHLGRTYYGPRGEILLALNDTLRLDSQEPGSPNDRSRNRPKKRKRLRVALIERDGLLCHYCKCFMMMPVGGRQPTPLTATIEHIVPRALGGSNEIYNLVLACFECNHDMGQKTNKCICPFCKDAEKRHFYNNGGQP